MVIDGESFGWALIVESSGFVGEVTIDDGWHQDVFVEALSNLAYK